jgi:hypothetical protein
VEKFKNEADGMISSKLKRKLKDLGRGSADHKVVVEYVLTEFENGTPIQDLTANPNSLYNINAAWKTALPAYRTPGGEQGQAAAEPQAAEDNVQDVDYEVKIILLSYLKKAVLKC